MGFGGERNCKFEEEGKLGHGRGERGKVENGHFPCFVLKTFKA